MDHFKVHVHVEEMWLFPPIISEYERVVVATQSPGPSRVLPDSHAATPSLPRSPSHGEHLQTKQ